MRQSLREWISLSPLPRDPDWLGHAASPLFIPPFATPPFLPLGQGWLGYLAVVLLSAPLSSTCRKELLWLAHKYSCSACCLLRSFPRWKHYPWKWLRVSFASEAARAPPLKVQKISVQQKELSWLKTGNIGLPDWAAGTERPSVSLPCLWEA